MHRLLSVVAVSLVAMASFAAESKLIWSIEVERPSGIPDRVVLSETRLNAGQRYTDDEISQAAAPSPQAGEGGQALSTSPRERGH